MKRAWLYIFPLVFLPTFSLAWQTPLGLLEITDFVMPVFFVALLFAQKSNFKQEIDGVRWPAVVFFAWAALGAMTIPLRFSGQSDWFLVAFCLAKLAKFLEYGWTGLLISRSLVDPETRRKWHWSVLAALGVMAIGLVETPATTAETQAYSNFNGVSVTICIVMAYIICTWFDGILSFTWQVTATVIGVGTLVALMMSGSTERHGRGGWSGLFAGVVYLFIVRSRSYKSVVMVVSVVTIIVVGYFALPSFHSLVDMTLSGEELHQERTFETQYGAIDQGARVTEWTHEAPKIVAHPVLGTGFFNREKAGLWSNGSHNFYIQMFLETGVGGGLLVAMIIVRLWSACGRPLVRLCRYSTPSRASIVCACVCGMSGEYFYGGLPLFALLAITAAALSVPALTDQELALALSPVPETT
jgi:hypothetical protein